jgi:pilus assembly protein CpaC
MTALRMAWLLAAIAATSFQALARPMVPLRRVVVTANRTHRTVEGVIPPLIIDVGSGQVVKLASAVTNVFVADPKVAEVRPASANTLFVFGTGPGQTTLAALDNTGRVVAQFQITVQPSAYNANQAAAAVARTMPGFDIHVDRVAGGLLVTGHVQSPEEADRVIAILQAYLSEKQTVENHLTVGSSTQISLRVRIAEMSRTVSREIGINWTAIQGLGKYAQIGLTTSNPVSATSATPNAFSAAYNIGNTNFGAVIDALAQDNLVHVLAEPNLTTLSGEPASFLVGGEFPIPIAQQNNTTTITFKQYGVNLSFVPTVLSGGRISVHVRPEVSQLSNQGAVQLGAGNSSISVPALTVRRADTTVEVASGDSFAIAGLLQDNVSQAVSALPWLGEVPILGALFRSDSFQRNESELVIIVTPYLVQPVSDPAKIRLPDDAYTPPSDLERILLLRQVGEKTGTVPQRIPGSAGFVLQ